MDRTTTTLVLVFMTATMAFGIKTTELASQVVATIQAENSVIQQKLQGDCCETLALAVLL